MINNSLWKGRKGEWYVIIQVLLMIFLFVGPQNTDIFPVWTLPYTLIFSIIGALLLLIGCLFFLLGIYKLGMNLTPLPYPKESSTLVETGPYKIVRHPIYCGGLFIAFGWAFWIHGSMTLLYAIILFVFLDIKSRREERWLIEKLPGYTGYQRRVRRLIPFIY
jgi:protein-S-isoprenylcysteine O-methyltransferase Ste14